MPTAVIYYLLLLYHGGVATLNLFRPGWNGWNGTRLLVVVASIPSCLCPV